MKTTRRALLGLAMVSLAFVSIARGDDPRRLRFEGGTDDQLRALVESAPAGAEIVCDQDVPVVVRRSVIITKPLTLRGLRANLPAGLGNMPVLIVDAPNVSLLGMEMRGNFDSVDQADRAPFVHIKRGGFRVEGCRFVDGSKDGLMVTPDDGAGDIVGGTIRDIDGLRMGRDLVSLGGGCGGQRIRDVTVENIRLVKGYHRGAVEVSDGSDDVRVRNVSARDAVYALDVQDHGARQEGKPAPSAPNTRVTIENVTAVDCKHLIRTANHALGHADLTVRNAVARNCAIPFAISNTTRVRLENLVITNDRPIGAAIQLRKLDDAWIQNVTIRGIGPGGKPIDESGSTNVRIERLTHAGQ